MIKPSEIWIRTTVPFRFNENFLNSKEMSDILKLYFEIKVKYSEESKTIRHLKRYILKRTQNEKTRV